MKNTLRRILILGGTGDARRLADRLTMEEGFHVILSLAGVTTAPAPVHDLVEMRCGGFGGAAGLAEYIRRANIAAVIDASHPFAAQISAHAADACDEATTPRFVLWRVPWVANDDDDWREFQTWDELIDAVPDGANIFLAAGQKGIRAFAESAGEMESRGIKIIARAMETPAAALPSLIQFIKGMPAKSWGDEAALFKKHAITHVVAKNAGGDAKSGDYAKSGGYAKLHAARHLGLPVFLLARPAPPPPPLFTDPDSLIAALRGAV